jgi:hypothetical protein
MSERIKSAAELAAVIVSLLALCVSIYFSHKTVVAANSAQAATLAHNEQSVRPFLDFKYKLGIGASDSSKEAGGFLRLANIGDGLAVITAVDATFDGLRIGTTAGELKALVEKNLENNDDFVANSLKVGQGISPGSHITVYLIGEKTGTDATARCRKDSARKKFAERLKVLVTYESKYGYKQTAPFEYEAGVGNCK